jgi:hypothetical protein
MTFTPGPEVNPYAPPAADYEPPGRYAASSGNPFYVVSPLKFWLLYLSLFGFYQIYWFFVNWRRYREYARANGWSADADIWPVMRAFFSIFFAHRLFHLMDETGRARGHEFSWAPGGFALVYVVVSLLGNGLNRFLEPLPGFITGCVVIGAIGYVLSTAQRVANITCGDPEGASNAGLGFGHYLCLAVGFGFWVLAFAGVTLQAE